MVRRTHRSLVAVIARRRFLRRLMVDDPRRWKPWELALLGKYSDKEVARRTGRSFGSVRGTRRHRGIERFGGKMRRWTKREDRLIRKARTWVQAASLATRIRRSRGAILSRQHALGLPKRLHPAHWPARHEALLGTMTDSALARRIHRTTEAVKCRRELRGIPPFKRQRPWTRVEDRILMRCSWREAARRLRRPLHSIQYRRRLLNGGVTPGHPSRPWTAREISLLGAMSDLSLGKRLRRTRPAVKAKRVELKVPPYGKR